jgi:AhpD family alkylhydroperoxidase
MKLPRWIARGLGWGQPRPVPRTQALVGYLALGRLPGFGGTLEERLALLAAGLAAELSGCRWCIDRCMHDARLAGLSPELLGQLRAYSRSALMNEREQAALAVVELIARPAVSNCGELVLQRARQFLSESQLAELTAIAAEHHCIESFNLSHF